MDYGLVVFPASGFPRKRLELVNCELTRLVSSCSLFSQQSGIRALVV